MKNKHMQRSRRGSLMELPEKVERPAWLQLREKNGQEMRQKAKGRGRDQILKVL